MATTSRAVVMLTVLVTFPAAWIYSGPLPNRAQRVVDRVVALGRELFGLAPMDPHPAAAIRSASQDAAPPFSQQAAGTELPSVVQSISDAPMPSQSSEVSPAPTAPVAAAGQTIGKSSDGHIGVQAELLLAKLRELGVAEYELEHWGSSGKLYRFHCLMPLAESSAQTRRFESVATDPLATIEQVVTEASSWRTTRMAHRGALR